MWNKRGKIFTAPRKGSTNEFACRSFPSGGFSSTLGEKYEHLMSVFMEQLKRDNILITGGFLPVFTLLR